MNNVVNTVCAAATCRARKKVASIMIFVTDSCIFVNERGIEDKVFELVEILP